MVNGMNALMPQWWQSAYQRAYDAVVSKGRRRNVPVDTRTEDKLLRPLDRDRLTSIARSLRRNAAEPAWAVRKHLDYVSTFTFQSTTPRRQVDDPAMDDFNRQVETLFDWWSRPENCDVSGRYSLGRMIRMLEELAVTEGDAFVYKVSSGHFQVIEGDRVRTPTDWTQYLSDYALEHPDQGPPSVDFSQYEHGVLKTSSGMPVRYTICDRDGSINGFVLRDVVQATYLDHHNGYTSNYSSFRGVSPLSAAMNTFFDLYESREYALAKMKISQILALKIKHGPGDGSEDSEGTVNFDPNQGSQTIELNSDEDASFLESQQPSTQFQSFYQVCIAIALKALDIPYSFYDESHTNYSGARQALLQYEQSCESKRAVLRQILSDLWEWRLQLFIADGDLILPDGMSIDDLSFEFIAAGLPWIDPLKEVTANALAVKSGFKSRQMICKESGDDYYRIVDQIAAENEYARLKGINPDIENATLPQDAIVDGEGAKEADPEQDAEVQVDVDGDTKKGMNDVRANVGN